MNYDHAYHAGSLADVLKHVFLVACLQHLQQKASGFFYLDTHAGRGLYDLNSNSAQKTHEALSGILALWPSLCQSKDPSLEAYVALLKPYEQQGTLHHYPGSILLARQLLRKQDRMAAAELQGSYFSQLGQQLGKNNACQLYNEDGYALLKRLLPPKERRGLILIDPPYESRLEWQHSLSALTAIQQRFATAMVVIWYPLKSKLAIQQWLSALKGLTFSSILHLSWWQTETMPSSTLSGAGLIVINPPWQFELKAQTLLKTLLSQQQTPIYRFQWEWLIPPT